MNITAASTPDPVAREQRTRTTTATRRGIAERGKEVIQGLGKIDDRNHRHTEGDAAAATRLLMNLGLINHGGFYAHSRLLAAELGVGPEFRVA